MFRNKSDILLTSLQRFFLHNKSQRIKQILPILYGKSKVSLRVIDWFVTNFSKQKNTRLYDRKTGRHCIVYLDYKAQLKAFSKKQFDPFCRRNRIQFFYNTTEFIDTTIGQLNFFRWALQRGLLKFLEDNLAMVENEMNVYYKRKTHIANRPTKLLASSANKHRNVSIILTFE